MRNILGYKFLVIEHSDMKWPCPIWFHVPIADERRSALNTIVTLEWLPQEYAWVQTIARDFHLPYAWALSATSTPPKAGNSGGTGLWIWYYRTSTATQDTSTSPATYQAYALQLLQNPPSGTPWYQVWVWRRAFGYPIRAFKNTPVIPDSTWTTIFDWSSTATWAWIFWDEDEWLISLSVDWEHWITMADKNVGATEVWSRGDTYLATNCWGFFQRWNNYMQPRTVSSTYSPYQSTKIDTTGYWPWNYFNQDIVVTIWTAPDSDWSSVQNDNLWGWVSQGTWREVVRA